MFCQECGYQLGSDQLVCPVCGKQVEIDHGREFFFSPNELIETSINRSNENEYIKSNASVSEYFHKADDIYGSENEDCLQITKDFDENAKWIADQKMTIDGQECTFHKDGYLVTGWLCTREDAVEKSYYYDDGAMVRGTSLEINGKEYSFDEEGVCLSKP